MCEGVAGGSGEGVLTCNATPNFLGKISSTKNSRDKVPLI